VAGRCCGWPPAPVPTRRGGLDHGADHFRMLPHAEIVVGAPDSRRLRGPFGECHHRMRKPARRFARDRRKNAVAPARHAGGLRAATEEFAVIHSQDLKAESLSRKWHSLFRAFPGLMSSRELSFSAHNGWQRVASGADQILIRNQHTGGVFAVSNMSGNVNFINARLECRSRAQCALAVGEAPSRSA